MRVQLIGRIWHVRFQISGKRITRTTREKSHRRALPVAEAIYREHLALSRGEYPTPTLRDALTEWIRIHENLRSGAHIRALDLFRRRHLYGLADIHLHRIGTSEVENAMAEHAKAHALATVNTWQRCLRLIFHWALRRKMIRTIPWEVPMPALQKRRKVTLPIGKVRPWLDALDASTTEPHIRLACRLMLLLGLRESEALGARWENLDLEAMTYTPHKTKGKESQAIPADLVVDYLRPLAQPFGLMMPDRECRAHGHNYCATAIRTANMVAQTIGISNHRLRGTFATLLHVVAGCDVHTVQRAMRHKDPRTTLGYLESQGDLAITAGLDRLRERLGMVRLKNGEQTEQEPRQC